jgi:hypothetical protein
MHIAGMIYGYARVSTDAQDLTSQLAQRKAAGCETMFREKITGTTAERPQLRKLLATLSTHRERQGRCEGEGCEVRAQAHPYPASTARGAEADCGGRDTAQRGAQLQRQSGDDFTARGMTAPQIRSESGSDADGTPAAAQTLPGTQPSGNMRLSPKLGQPKYGSPALCVDCAGFAPTFGLGDRPAYLERRMNKLWPVPDCRIEQITPDGPPHLRTVARSFRRARRCPDCGRVSPVVHSRYKRRLADLPSLRHSVSVHLWVRRFYCRSTNCARQTFVEGVLAGKRACT